MSGGGPAPDGRPEILALFGPTGIGKTAVAVALAERLRARGEDPVAISADALQVYAGLETLTGAPTEDEHRRLEHRLVAFIPVSESFSVGQYMPLAHREIDAALAAGRRPIVVGGTGLYVRAALTELDLRPPPAPGVRERVEARLAARGPAALHAELSRRSPAAAEGIDAADRSRIGRALESLEGGHHSLAVKAPGGESQLWTSETRRPTLLVGLLAERSALYGRIGRRVSAMVAAGAGEEVRRAAAAGASPTARAALGFEELLAGDVEGLERRTRNLAKRQLTWMRKLAGVHHVDVTGRDPGDVAEEIAVSL
ncbi:MAG: tRNA (adenosine(37)-N6)-dimethylallyltransferase MiaA [Actinomycetota bacterium]|nr:tRNA (adenosine(37)-N6)-dimethylallyltransferase MiaA [Actinomycetota bacterium]